MRTKTTVAKSSLSDMLNSRKRAADSSSGFTIIEVMIVLAIAALILLIVLLAVPALQRSSRNTQRKNDVSAIAAAVSNYISDNNGQLPGGLGKDSSSTVIDICATGDGSSTQSGQTACTKNIETATVGYYTADAVWIDSGVTTVGTVAAGSEANDSVSTDSVFIDLGTQCNTSDVTSPTVQSRSVAIFFATETGSGNGALQCVDA